MAAILDILLLFGVPMSVGGIVGLLSLALITFIAIVIADRFIAHNIEIKHALILSFAAYFVTILASIGLVRLGISFGSEVILVYIIPLLVWIGLGEVLLQADRRTKLFVAVAAFIIYIILRDVVQLHTIISSIIPI